MSRSQAIMLFSAFIAALAGAYFVLWALKPDALARVLLRRGYEQRGWTEKRLAARIRVIGILGAALALAAILLAVVKFIR